MTQTGESFYSRYDWFPCKRKDVKTGDILANSGTVTASRKAKRGEWWGDHGPTEDNHKGKWHIVVGKSFSTTADADDFVIIGRRKVVAS